MRRARDRKRFGEFVRKLGLRQIDGAWAESAFEARECAEKLGYPLLARSSEEPPRLVEIIYDDADLEAFLAAEVERAAATGAGTVLT